MGVSLNVIFFCRFRNSLSLYSWPFIYVSLCGSPLGSFSLELCASWPIFLPQLRDVSAISSNKFSVPFSLPSFWDVRNANVCLWLPKRSLQLWLFFKILFLLFSLGACHYLVFQIPDPFFFTLYSVGSFYCGFHLSYYILHLIGSFYIFCFFVGVLNSPLCAAAQHL